MDVLISMCCWLCLQAEGGKRTGAVATVVAAVDLARVRQPAHVKSSQAEEKEAELKQQMTATIEHEYRAAERTMTAQAGYMLTAAQEVEAEATLPSSQVSQDRLLTPISDSQQSSRTALASHYQYCQLIRSELVSDRCL